MKKKNIILSLVLLIAFISLYYIFHQYSRILKIVDSYYNIDEQMLEVAKNKQWDDYTKLMNKGANPFYCQDNKSVSSISYMFAHLIKRNDMQHYVKNNIMGSSNKEQIENILSKIIPSNKNISLLEEANNIDKSLNKIQKIAIPYFSKATFPTIVKYQDHYLMYFRYNTPETNDKKEDSLFYLVELDKYFAPLSSPQLISNNICSDDDVCRTEDARLFYFKSDLYVTFNKEIHSQRNTSLKRDMYLSKVTKVNGKFILENPIRMLSPFNSFTEKNWSPMVFKNKLYFIYSIDPFILIEPNLETGQTKIVVKSSLSNHSKGIFGELRATTPTIDIEKDKKYLTIFHSRIAINNGSLYYFYFPAFIECKERIESCHISKKMQTPIFYKHTLDLNPQNVADQYFASIQLLDDEIILSSSDSVKGPINLYFINKKSFLNILENN